MLCLRHKKLKPSLWVLNRLVLRVPRVDRCFHVARKDFVFINITLPQHLSHQCNSVTSVRVCPLGLIVPSSSVPFKMPVTPYWPPMEDQDLLEYLLRVTWGGEDGKGSKTESSGRWQEGIRKGQYSNIWCSLYRASPKINTLRFWKRCRFCCVELGTLIFWGNFLLCWKCNGSGARSSSIRGPRGNPKDLSHERSSFS